MESETSASHGSSAADRTQSIASAPPHDHGGVNDRPAVELLTRSEGWVLLAGVALTLGFLVWLGFETVKSPAQSHAMWVMSALTATVGRPTAMAVAYSMELSRVMVFGIAATVETAVVLVFYPLIAFGCQHLIAIKPLQNFSRRSLEAASAHQTSIRRYGPLGLFAFVMLVPYGSPIGAVIGFLLRMPVWLNLTTVLAGTYVATFLWTVFLDRLHAFASSYGPYATAALIAVLLAITVAGHLTHRAARSRVTKSGQ